jgi:MFS family permease
MTEPQGQEQGWGPVPPSRPGPSNAHIWRAIAGFVLGLLLGPFLGVFIGAVLTGEGRTTAWRVIGVLVFPILFAWLFARRKRQR